MQQQEQVRKQQERQAAQRNPKMALRWKIRNHCERQGHRRCEHRAVVGQTTHDWTSKDDDGNEVLRKAQALFGSDKRFNSLDILMGTTYLIELGLRKKGK